MRPSSVQAELEAEIGRLRDLLEREKLDSRRGEDQVRFQARLLDAVHEAVIATDPSGIVYIGTASQRGFMAGRLRRRLAETSWS